LEKPRTSTWRMTGTRHRGRTVDESGNRHLLRDRHMREKYLQVAQFPRAELLVQRNALQLPAPGASASSDAPGIMKIHGRSKEVKFHYDVSVRGPDTTFTHRSP